MRITLILLFFSLGLNAQEISLDEKYFHYRQRLLNEFIYINWDGDAIGEYNEETQVYSEAGHSLPCSGIMMIYKAQGYWEYDYPNCKDNLDITDKPNVKKWADATLHLGYYWSVLATEYALLMRQGRTDEAQRTTQELYLALRAYKRLDLTGQQIARTWNDEEEKRCEVDLLFTGNSGFFVRDDVPRSFYKKVDAGGIVSSMACREKPTDFFRKVGKGNVISHDQNASLLMGLSFINKAYEEKIFNINGKEVNIKSMARKITFGLVSHVHKSRIRRIKFPPCRSKIVQTGGNSFVYAFPMRKVLDYLAPSHGIRSTLWDRFSWEFFAEDMAVSFARALGIASNDNVGMYLTYTISADMESMSDVVSVALSASQKEFFPFAKAYVHNHPISGIPTELKDRMYQLLLECPMAGTGKDAEGLSDSWDSDNRWRTYEKNKAYNGRGNGLDFMLSCNVYRLLYENEEELNSD